MGRQRASLIVAIRLAPRRKWIGLLAGAMFLKSNGHAVEPVPHAAVHDVPPFGLRTSSGVVALTRVDWFEELASEARLGISVELPPFASCRLPHWAGADRLGGPDQIAPATWKGQDDFQRLRVLIEHLVVALIAAARIRLPCRTPSCRSEGRKCRADCRRPAGDWFRSRDERRRHGLYAATAPCGCFADHRPRTAQLSGKSRGGSSSSVRRVECSISRLR